MINTLSWTAFKALVRKDLWLWAGNRRSLIVGLVAPVAIAAFFGYLFDSRRGDAGRVQVVVTDQDRSALSAKVLAGLQADKALEVTTGPADEAARKVQRGEVRAAIVLPAGFGAQATAALMGGPRPSVKVHYDPSQAMVLPMVRGLLAQQVMGPVLQGLAGGMGGPLAAMMGGQLPPPAASGASPADGSTSATTATATPALRPPFDTDERAATARNGAQYNSYAHSFAGMGVQFILLTGIDFGIALLLARRMGLWQRLSVAPISRGVLLGSRVASAALIALGMLLAIFAAGALLFGVRIQGSVLGFIGVAIAFALMTASFGLLIAAIGKTPETTRGLAVLATLMLVMLGGAWAPSFIFPPWLQTLSLATPTRWAVDGLDAVTWRGLGLAAVLPQVGAMLACSAVFTALALWRFDRGPAD